MVKKPHLSSTTSFGTSEKPVGKHSKLFSFMDKLDPESVTSTTSSPAVFNEVDNYFSVPILPEDEDPPIFWEKNQNLYPTLSQLAEYYLSVPASSAPVERLFSIAGKIFRPERCRLTDKTLEQLMLIRCNAHL